VNANEFYIFRKCRYIVFILQCQTAQKQLPNSLKRAKTSVVLILPLLYMTQVPEGLLILVSDRI
jgi:hypothetical protein